MQLDQNQLIIIPPTISWKRSSPNFTIEKFALKFKNDKSFQMLEAALAKKDWHEAFVAAHTLKGVAGNISFTKMHKAAAALTEQLRPEKEIDNMDLFNALKACYDDTIAKLNQFEMIQ